MSSPDDPDQQDGGLVDESVQDDEGLYDIGVSSLTYFGADFDVAGLVRRLQDDDIIIPRFDPDNSAGTSLEGFQRNEVWGAPRRESFIESLLLGWPVPSIFLVVEPDQRYLVLDGQQRLTSLRRFYEGQHADGRPFVLRDVAEHLKGASYETLTKESRRRLNNTFIQAVVIEPQGSEGGDSVYRLFGRLNSGGVALTSQQIRVALYRGKLVNFIRELNKDSAWRKLFGPNHNGQKDHELILRVLAMTDVLTEMRGGWHDQERRLRVYKPPMARFLNSFLDKHRNGQDLDLPAIKDAFHYAVSLVLEAEGDDGLKLGGRLNAAHVDALLSSLMANFRIGNTLTAASARRVITKLRQPGTGYARSIERSTSHRESVYGRLEQADLAVTQALREGT